MLRTHAGSTRRVCSENVAAYLNLLRRGHVCNRVSSARMNHETLFPVKVDPADRLQL